MKIPRPAQALQGSLAKLTTERRHPRGIANGSRERAPDDGLRDEPGIWSLACERYNLEIPGSLRAQE
jgi:hypothetical protein